MELLGRRRETGAGALEGAGAELAASGRLELTGDGLATGGAVEPTGGELATGEGLELTGGGLATGGGLELTGGGLTVEDGTVEDGLVAGVVATDWADGLTAVVRLAPEAGVAALATSGLVACIANISGRHTARRHGRDRLARPRRTSIAPRRLLEILRSGMGRSFPRREPLRSPLDQ